MSSNADITRRKESSYRRDVVEGVERLLYGEVGENGLSWRGTISKEMVDGCAILFKSRGAGL